MLKIDRFVVYSLAKAFSFVMGVHSYLDREILPAFLGVNPGRLLGCYPSLLFPPLNIGMAET